MQPTKHDIISQLEKDILPLQGYKPPAPGNNFRIGLGPIEKAFPNNCFPTGAVHEFLTMDKEGLAATAGFVAGIISNLMKQGGTCLWLGKKKTLFPRALPMFGIDPSRIIFVETAQEKQIVWAMEEALKCEGLAAVVGDLREIDLTGSRRLQLAVEQSRVTGFLLRQQPRDMNPIACVARWQITPLPSWLEDNTPGVGFPRWQVELLKVRNGRPGKWQVEWSAGRFHSLSQQTPVISGEQKRKTG